MTEFYHSCRWSWEELTALCVPEDPTEWLTRGRFFLGCFNSHIGYVCLTCTSKCARKTKRVALTGESENPILQNVLPLVLCGGGKTKSLCWETWDQEFKMICKHSFRFKLQQNGKARLNLRKTRDLHVSTTRPRNAIFHFCSFLNDLSCFLEQVLMQENEKVWGSCMEW